MSSHGAKLDVEPVIFREYIGMKPYPDPFNTYPDIVNSKIKEFHFIVGFAHETYNEDKKGTGVFKTDWPFEFTKQDVLNDLKNQHPNVKVVITIGGRDGDVPDAKYPFFPIEKDSWCNNAFNSLKDIIQKINGSNASCCQKLIDGIDIYYEQIKTHEYDEYDFSDYIKEVITRLKKVGIIDVVSIAPSHQTHEHYRRLYSACRVDINWVNYQFYMQSIPTEADFRRHFDDISAGYDAEKLLAGASTDPRDTGNVPRDVFLKSCTKLVRSKNISGIFIWNANDSAYNFNSNEHPPFDLEKIAQDILTEQD